jgi:hypothetical protein
LQYLFITESTSILRCFLQVQGVHFGVIVFTRDARKTRKEWQQTCTRAAQAYEKHVGYTSTNTNNHTTYLSFLSRNNHANAPVSIMSTFFLPSWNRVVIATEDLLPTVTNYQGEFDDEKMKRVFGAAFFNYDQIIQDLRSKL